MQTQLTNIKKWLHEIISEAIHDAFRTYQIEDNPTHEFLTAKEAAAFIGDALPTFYKRVSEGEIPTKGGGKKIWVKKADLLAWLDQDRTYSKSQLEEEAIKKMIESRKS